MGLGGGRRRGIGWLGVVGVVLGIGVGLALGSSASARDGKARGAGEGASVEEAFALANYYYGTLQFGIARDRLAEVLARDPGYLEAHHLYVLTMRVFGLGEDDVLVAQYRAWHAAAPDDEVRRVALAMALISDHGRQDEVRDEVLALLEPLPVEPEARYWALWAHMLTPDSPRWGSIEQEMVVLDCEDPRTGLWVLGARFEQGPVDEDLAADWIALLGRSPRGLALAGGLWREGIEGPALDQVREAALAAGQEALSGTSLPALHGARWMFDAAGDPESVARADARLRELDPGYSMGDPLNDEIDAVTTRLSPEIALANLEALAPRVPASGRTRATYERTRASLLHDLDRMDECLTASIATFDAVPYTGNRGERWQVKHCAWTALQLEARHDEALRVVDAALAWTEADDLGAPWVLGTRWADHDAWRESHQEHLAEFLDLRAQLLAALGRHDEARSAWRRSLELADDEDVHRRLGHAYRAAGEPGPAFEHLARAAAMEQLRLGEVAAEDRAALDALFPDTGYWNARGASGHVDALAEVLAERGVVTPDEVIHIEEVGAGAGAGAAGAGGGDAAGASAGGGAGAGGVAGAGLPAENDHPLLGQPCPELTFTVGGEQRQLSAIPGVRVVELWNTW